MGCAQMEQDPSQNENGSFKNSSARQKKQGTGNGIKIQRHQGKEIIKTEKSAMKKNKAEAAIDRKISSVRLKKRDAAFTESR